MDSFVSRLSRFTVQHRWVPTLLVMAITAVTVIGHVDPNIILDLFETDEVVAAESEGAKFDPLPDVDPVSLSGSDVVVVVQGDDFFTPRAAEAMRAVVNDLENLPEVRSILWLDRVPVLNIFGLRQPLLPSEKATQQRFEAARKQALEHPLVGGQLLSKDTRTLLLLINLELLQVQSDAEATTMLGEVARKAAEPFDDVSLTFLVTGRVPATIAAVSRHESNQMKYQLIGYGMIFIMTIVLFRGIRAVIIVALAPVLGVFWTLGGIRYLGFQQNPLIDVILPVLVSLVGLTDGVHLMVQIRKLRASGMPEREAAGTGLRQVGMACFLTSLTTAIGFGSLMLAESQWVQEFGKCAVLGVVLTFISVVTVIPLACSTWLGRLVHVGHENSLIDRNLARISHVIDAVLKRSRTMCVLSIICTLALFGVSMTLTPDQRQANDLPEGAEATLALQHMDKAFGGLEFGEVRVSWSPDIASDSPEILRVVGAVDELLRTESLISSPLSIRNLIDAQPGSGPPEERMTLLELLPPPLKRAFFTPERRTAKVTFRVQDLGIATYGPVFERIESAIEEMETDHPQFQFDLRGSAVWRWENLYQIVVDLAKSLGSASVIIFVVLSVVYRSLRLGLISIIPNLFPLVFTGAYLAVAGYNLEIVMVCNFTICLGIAVDDTIHFLTRYLEERETAPDEDTAIRNAFTGVGTALIMTTTVLVVGFSVVTFSESRDHRIFATMGALTIAAALFGDLVFLPALLRRFARPPTSTLMEPASVESLSGTNEAPTIADGQATGDPPFDE